MYEQPKFNQTLVMATRYTVGIAEAAQMLGVSRAVAYEMAHRGELPVIRCGRRPLLRVPLARLLALLGQDA